MVSRFGNSFRLGCITYGASKGLHTLVLAGGLLGDSAAVPCMAGCFFFTAEGTAVLMAGAIGVCPAAIFMVSRFGNSFRLGCITYGASKGLHTLVLAGRLFGDATAVPCMAGCFFFTAERTSVLMVGAIGV